MIKRCRTLLSLASVPLLFCGCVAVDAPSNPPLQQKVHLITSSPADSKIRVIDSIFSLDQDGRTEIAIPRLGMHGQLYLLGILKVSDHSPYRQKSIEILRGEKVVKRLSIDGLSKLPVDDAGYRIVKLH
jgi:hypothetical protein